MCTFSRQNFVNNSFSSSSIYRILIVSRIATTIKLHECVNSIIYTCCDERTIDFFKFVLASKKTKEKLKLTLAYQIIEK